LYKKIDFYNNSILISNKIGYIYIYKMVFKQPKYLIRKDLDNIKKRLLINNKNLPIKEKIVITNKPDGLLTKIDFDYNGLIKISNTYDEVVIQNYNNKHFSFEGRIYCEKVLTNNKEFTSYLLFDIDVKKIKVSKELNYIVNKFLECEHFNIFCNNFKVDDKYFSIYLKNIEEYKKLYIYRLRFLSEVFTLFMINDLLFDDNKRGSETINLKNTFVKRMKYLNNYKDFPYDFDDLNYNLYQTERFIEKKDNLLIYLNCSIFLYFYKNNDYNINKKCHSDFYLKILDLIHYKNNKEKLLEKKICEFKDIYLISNKLYDTYFYDLTYDGVVIYFDNKVLKFKLIPTLKCKFNYLDGRLYTEDNFYVGKLDYSISQLNHKLGIKCCSDCGYFNTNTKLILEIFKSEYIKDKNKKNLYKFYRIRNDRKRSNTKKQYDRYINSSKLNLESLFLTDNILNFSLQYGYFSNLKRFMKNQNFCYRIKKTFIIDYLFNIYIKNDSINVLDVGCGKDGIYHYLKLLFNKKSVNLDLLDKSQKSINKILKKKIKYELYTNKKIIIRTFNKKFLNYKSNIKYDLITIFNSLNNFNDKNIKKIYNLLNDRGYVIILFMDSNFTVNIEYPFLVKDMCNHKDKRNCDVKCKYNKIRINKKKCFYEKKMFKNEIINNFRKFGFKLIDNKNFNSDNISINKDFNSLLDKSFEEFYEFYEVLILKKKSIDSYIHYIKNSSLHKVFDILNCQIKSYLTIIDQSSLNISIHNIVSVEKNLSIWKNKNIGNDFKNDFESSCDSSDYSS
jgi:SAM-dependent methyltransferase